MNKLCFEATKVEDELRNAEAEAVYNRRILVAVQQEHQQHKSELEFLRGRVGSYGYDLKTSEKDIGTITEKIEMVATSSKALQKDKKFIRDHFGSFENVTNLVLQVITDWRRTVDGFTSENIISTARQNVDLLKDKRDALVNAPERVCFLQKSLDHHLTDKGCLEKEVILQYTFMIERRNSQQGNIFDIEFCLICCSISCEMITYIKE